MSAPQFSLSPSLVLRRTAYGNWVIDGPGYKNYGAGPRMSALADLLQEARELLERSRSIIEFEFGDRLEEVRAFLAKTGAPDLAPSAPAAPAPQCRSCGKPLQSDDEILYCSLDCFLDSVEENLVPEAKEPARWTPVSESHEDLRLTVKQHAEAINALYAEMLRLRKRDDAPYGNWRKSEGGDIHV